ncbi:MAG: PAP/fibrillin family protein [Thermostichales cyanobacterium BF3_bins_165]
MPKPDKSALLAAIAPTQRGEQATPEQQQHILALVAALEATNPPPPPHPPPPRDDPPTAPPPNTTPAPTATPELLNGNWRTLYTTSRDLLGLSGLPGIRAGEIYQCIVAERQQVFNIAEIASPLPLTQGIIAIRARFQGVSPRRVTVVFEQLLLGWTWLINYRIETFVPLLIQRPQQIPALKIPIRQPSGRPSWLDITYLDADLRIGRGSQGSLFILEKV